MSDPASISEFVNIIFKIISIFTTIILVILGVFLRRLFKNISEKVSRTEYEEFKKTMSGTLDNMNTDFEKGSKIMSSLDQRLDDMKTILMAVAIKMEVTDTKQIIEKYLLGNERNRD